MKNSSSSAGYPYEKGAGCAGGGAEVALEEPDEEGAGEGHRQVYILTVGERIEALVVKFSLEEWKPLL